MSKYSKPTTCSFLIALVAIFFCASPFSNAAEVKGIKVPDQISCGDCTLVLNGTAVRSVLGFKVYVAGLYLTEANRDHEAIMNQDRSSKRVHLTLLRKVTGDKFESTIQQNIQTNFSVAEREHFASELKQFLGCFRGGANLDKGSVVNIDYQPEQGTLVSVDGRSFEAIPGDDFYHAVLRLWIGKPPQKSVKYGLLGVAG